MGKERKTSAFEFCEVCRLNHDNGRKHRYLPRHKTALSSLLSRFLLKLSPLRSSLRHPSFLRRPHPQPPSLWCVFCTSDIPHSPSSSVQGEDAIRHLSGSEHLANLKEFLWKHGGGMDRLDSFRVSDSDLLKWEKKCETLRTLKEMSNGQLQGPMDSKTKDIHNQFTSRNVDTFGNEMPTYFCSRNSYGVVPLQNHTNERCEPFNCEAGRIPEGASGLPTSIPCDFDSQNIGNKTVGTCTKPSFLDPGQMIDSSSSSKMDENATGKRRAIGRQNFDDLPRLETNGVDSISIETKRGFFNIPSIPEEGKPRKLNPNRVGAAWAEKRRAELELEKKGLTVTHYDPDWLPDFGRVWQAGTRKESRKEFVTETRKQKKVPQPERSVPLQPYVSKRMRMKSQEHYTASINSTWEGLPH